MKVLLINLSNQINIKSGRQLFPVSINDVSIPGSGTYLLRIQPEGQAISKQVIKLKR